MAKGLPWPMWSASGWSVVKRMRHARRRRLEWGSQPYPLRKGEGLEQAFGGWRGFVLRAALAWRWIARARSHT